MGRRGKNGGYMRRARAPGVIQEDGRKMRGIGYWCEKRDEEWSRGEEEIRRGGGGVDEVRGGTRKHPGGVYIEPYVPIFASNYVAKKEEEARCK